MRRRKFKKWSNKRNREEEQKETANKKPVKAKWIETNRSNSDFEKYYKEQKIVKEEEWDEFLNILKTDLPSTFRINLAGEHSDMIDIMMRYYWVKKLDFSEENKRIAASRDSASNDHTKDSVMAEAPDQETGSNQEIAALPANVETEEETADIHDQGQLNEPHEAEAAKSNSVSCAPEKEELLPDPPKLLDWYPCDLGWTWKTSKNAVRKKPELQSFHKWLIATCDLGLITRQEAVSMIPPLFLDVESHHRIIDMCASPGSKTSEIAELMEYDARKKNTVVSGVLMANDVDESRCHTLVHNTKRIKSPALMITHEDASQFKPPKPVDRDKVTGEWIHYQYDRVLADVPCSGDGTVRKAMDIWRNWKTSYALVLHSTQYAIALRGANLLKVGGRMVYSTCSFNPLENEAIVASIIRSTKGAMELVDVSDKLPSLKRRNGLHTWKVLGRDGLFYDKHSELKHPEDIKKHHESIFPPTEEEVAYMHLERCMRFLPHDQDTGGFFVAVLEKKREFSKFAGVVKSAATTQKQEDVVNGSNNSEPKSEISTETALPTESGESNETKVTSEQAVETNNEGNANKGKRVKQAAERFGEAPCLVCEGTDWDQRINRILSENGLTDQFPKNQLICRNEDFQVCNKIYFVTTSVAAVLKSNSSQLKIMHAGVQVFEKCKKKDSKMLYRIVSEGHVQVLPYISGVRTFELPKEELLSLLKKADVHKNSLPTELAAKLQSVPSGLLFAECHIGSRKLRFLTWNGTNRIRTGTNKNETAILVQFLELLEKNEVCVP